MQHDKASLQIIAALLRHLGERTEQIGTMLCGDPEFVSQHFTQLQEIDAMSQRQMAIADLLESADLEQSLRECRLEWVAAAFSGEALSQPFEPFGRSATG